MLSQLNKKVEEVYRNCIGDNEANIRYDNYQLNIADSIGIFMVLVNVSRE